MNKLYYQHDDRIFLKAGVKTLFRAVKFRAEFNTISLRCIHYSVGVFV